MTTKRKPEGGERWWETTPALIGAVASLIVAITGVVTVFINRPTPQSNIQQPVALADKENLLNNGGFEDGLKFWGTGYYETDVYHGSLGIFWASRVGEKIEVMKIADIRGEINLDIHKSGSKQSFKITNNSPMESNIYGSMSQKNHRAIEKH